MTAETSSLQREHPACCLPAAQGGHDHQRVLVVQLQPLVVQRAADDADPEDGRAQHEQARANAGAGRPAPRADLVHVQVAALLKHEDPDRVARDLSRILETGGRGQRGRLVRK
ncbi:MAG TPA: hypothetical protein VNN79_24645, partial [Actinomycetota bacterium]|nr:hypothetical protein [Actinomycetota bacterium]